MFDYGWWANARLITVVSKLTPEEFTREAAGSYGSIRNTLVHAMSAEWGWLERCGGAARGEKLNPADYPTADSIERTWKKVERSMRDLLDSLTDHDLSRTVEFSLGGEPKRVMRVGQLLHHAANHSVHHRGQVALLLRSIGHPPGNFDLLIYYARGS